MKLCFVDVETTGLDPKVNSICEIAAIFGHTSDLTGPLVEEHVFESVMRPFGRDKPDPEALEINGITMEDLRTYPAQKIIHDEFRDWCREYVDPYNKRDKMWFVAYNASFDWQFCYNWFTRLGDEFFGSLFYTPFIDVMSIMGFYLMEERDGLSNFKLQTVAKKMGLDIKQSQLHNALYDADLVRQLFAAVIETPNQHMNPKEEDDIPF